LHLPLLSWRSLVWHQMSISSDGSLRRFVLMGQLYLLVFQEGHVGAIL